MNTRLAQATQVPENGASRAEDFQPQTRNPQTAPVNLQPNGNDLQQGANQQLLTDNPNLRITVPVNPARRPAERPSIPADGGTSSILIVVIVVVTFIIGWFFWRRGDSEFSAAQMAEPEPVPAPKPKKPKKKEKKSRGRTGKARR